MQDKQKVTLYLPPELHRQLKIKAAVEAEPMSLIAERALSFYLSHSEVVDQLEASYGRTHQVHACPECSSPVVVFEGELVSLKRQPGVVAEAEELPTNSVVRREGLLGRDDLNLDEEALVPC
jgi:hypothetical protein